MVLLRDVPEGTRVIISSSPSGSRMRAGDVGLVLEKEEKSVAVESERDGSTIILPSETEISILRDTETSTLDEKERGDGIKIGEIRLGEIKFGEIQIGI